MCARRGEFDWFECNQRITVMADYLLDTTQSRAGLFREPDGADEPRSSKWRR